MQGRGDHENIREPFKWYDVTALTDLLEAQLFNTGNWQPSVETRIKTLGPAQPLPSAHPPALSEPASG